MKPRNSYITPCNKNVQTIIKHEKFFRGHIETVFEELQKEKEAKPRLTPYYFLFSPSAVGYTLFCYLKNNKLVTEHIKIDHRGFIFHKATFVYLSELLRYVKENQNRPDYLRSIERPVEIIEDSLDSPLGAGFGIGNILTIKNCVLICFFSL